MTLPPITLEGHTRAAHASSNPSQSHHASRASHTSNFHEFPPACTVFCAGWGGVCLARCALSGTRTNQAIGALSPPRLDAEPSRTCRRHRIHEVRAERDAQRRPRLRDRARTAHA
eukprot:7002792-Prymnesium_polylepis.1